MADTLADFIRMFAEMSPEEKAAADELLAPELKAPWLSLAGPQQQAQLSKADLLLYGGAAGGGKLLDLATPLPSPKGWVLVRDVAVGDALFDERGAVCTVQAVSPLAERPKTYAVTFDDGARIVACADHRWLTFDASELAGLTRLDDGFRERRRASRPRRAKGNKSETFSRAIALRNSQRDYVLAEPPTGTVRTTQEIADTLVTRSGRRNHAIPVAAPLDLPDADLPIPPYTFGAWLGDGNSANGGMTGIDDGIWTEIEADGFVVTHSAAEAKRHYVRALGTKLRLAGLRGNKHIPLEYLRASFAQRLALLQGLMDTDGYATDSGACEFTNTNKRIIDGAYELLASLGIKATIREGVAKLDGRAIGPKWRLKFTTALPAFRLQRKLERQNRKPRRTTTFRYVCSCEEIDPVPMRCIAVNSPSRLYLAGPAMVPTHNTDLLIGLALTEHSRSVIFRRAYVDLRGVEERMLEIRGTRDGYNASDMVLKTDDGRLLEFGALEKPGAEMSWQGRPHDFIGFDEGSQLAEAKVRFVLGWLRSSRPGQRTRAAIATNPPIGAEGGWLVDWFAPWLDPLFPEPAKDGELRWSVMSPAGKTLWVPGPGHYIILGEDTAEATDEEIASGHALEALSRTFIPARLEDNPYLRGTGYRAKLQALPEPLRSQLLKGDFLAGKEDAANQVIPTAWIEAAQKRWSRGKPADAKMLALGVDVAQGGADETVLAPLYGSWFADLIKRKGVDTKNGASVGALIIETMRDRCNINVDYTGGWGGGAVTHLTGAGISASQINSVVFSAGSNRKTKDGLLTFANLRAELWWAFREALDPESREEVALPPDRRLAAQLAAPTWKLRGESILVESKDDIRKRLGSSTDDADAVILAWHQREPVALTNYKRRERRDVA